MIFSLRIEIGKERPILLYTFRFGAARRNFFFADPTNTALPTPQPTEASSREGVNILG